MTRPVTLVLVGSTGLVGRHVLDLALADPRVGQVIAPTRRTIRQHPKLQHPQVDYEHLPIDAELWRADAVICTLGTTIRVAGSPAAFRRVDHDYPLKVAQLAHAQGTPTYILNSAVGAHAQSRFFYNRVKGELEQDLKGVGFSSLTFVRPGLIGGDRDVPRLGERAMVIGLTWLKPLLPKKWRLNPAKHIAQALLDAALTARPGEHVIIADQLV